VSIEVVIPWRGGDPHRQAALEHILGWWGQHDLPVTVAGLPDGPWVKTLAVTPAVAASTAEVIVVADADVICDGIGDAIREVRSGSAWAVPHGTVHRLDQPSTAAVLAGADPADGACIERPYKGFPGGGMVVLPRDVFLDAPLPYVEGWGQEDQCFSIALTALYGKPWRGSAPLFHLWHPPQPRQNRGIGSDESLRLFRRYKTARHDPDRMRALINETKEAQHGGLHGAALHGQPLPR
jgi:hypothetical protein